MDRIENVKIYIMNPIFEYVKRGEYTHMSPVDKVIWERFIDTYPNKYDSVQYDFRVGDPPPFNPLMPDGEDLNQDALYRLRIDVVGRDGNNRNIIEIKPNAGPSTIGQVKSYKALYTRDEEPKGITSMLIITDKIQPNMEWLCKLENVKIIAV